MNNVNEKSVEKAFDKYQSEMCVLCCFTPFSTLFQWQSVILEEEAVVPGEHHWPAASHWQTLSHNVVTSTPRHERDSNSQLF